MSNNINNDGQIVVVMKVDIYYMAQIVPKTKLIVNVEICSFSC